MSDLAVRLTWLQVHTAGAIAIFDTLFFHRNSEVSELEYPSPPNNTAMQDAVSISVMPKKLKTNITKMNTKRIRCKKKKKKISENGL